MANIWNWMTENLNNTVTTSVQKLQNSYDSMANNVNFLKKSLFVGQNLSMEEQAAKECESLVITISKTQAQFSDLKEFIKSKSDLNALCLEFLQKFPDYIAVSKIPNTDNLDPENNIFHKKIVLGLKKNQIEHDLKECLHFIVRHKEIHECFKKHVESESSPSKTRFSSLLLTDKE